MLVIIEGTDGSGKTTLIENLRNSTKRYFAIIRASTYPPDGRGRPYMKAANEFHNLYPGDVILDRYHAISENIYGPLLRGTIPQTIETIMFDLLEVDLIVYCRPPAHIIRKTVLQNTQMEGVIEKTNTLIERYDDFMDKLRVKGKNVLHYDWTDQPLSVVSNVAFGRQHGV